MRRLNFLWICAISFLGVSFSQLAAQSCQSICQQYEDFARGRGQYRGNAAGADGTYGPLVRMYNQCLACRNQPARRQVRCPAGYMPSDDGEHALCMLINCPTGTVREWDGTCIDARGIGHYSPEE